MLVFPHRLRNTVFDNSGFIEGMLQASLNILSLFLNKVLIERGNNMMREVGGGR